MTKYAWTPITEAISSTDKPFTNTIKPAYLLDFQVVHSSSRVDYVKQKTCGYGDKFVYELLGY